MNSLPNCCSQSSSDCNIMRTVERMAKRSAEGAEERLAKRRQEWVDNIVEKVLSQSKTDDEVIQLLRLERRRRTVWAKRTPPVGETAEERKLKFANGREKSRITRAIEVQKWKQMIEQRRKLNDFEPVSNGQEDQSKNENEEFQNRE